jgi:hypothetical protein
MFGSRDRKEVIVSKARLISLLMLLALVVLSLMLAKVGHLGMSDGVKI